MNAQPQSTTDLVRLKKAVLCVNCEVISEGLNGHCACCGGQSLLDLRRLLGGTTMTEPPLRFARPPKAGRDSANDAGTTTLPVAA